MEELRQPSVCLRDFIRWRPPSDAEDHIWLLFCVDVEYSIDRSPLPTLHLQPRHARRRPGFGPALRGFLSFCRRSLLAPPARGGCFLALALGGLFALTPLYVELRRDPARIFAAGLDGPSTANDGRAVLLYALEYALLTRGARCEEGGLGAENFPLHLPCKRIATNGLLLRWRRDAPVGARASADEVRDADRTAARCPG